MALSHKQARDLEETLAWIRAAKQVFPSQRVCQLIVNATNKSDPFYVEDSELREALESYIRQYKEMDH